MLEINETEEEERKSHKSDSEVDYTTAIESEWEGWDRAIDKKKRR